MANGSISTTAAAAAAVAVAVALVAVAAAEEAGTVDLKGRQKTRFDHYVLIIYRSRSGRHRYPAIKPPSIIIVERHNGAEIKTCRRPCLSAMIQYHLPATGKQSRPALYTQQTTQYPTNPVSNLVLQNGS